MKQFPKLSNEEVRIGVEACRKKALDIGVPMDIAVTDESGFLLGFERMDGGLVGCIQIAIDKAFTASVLGVRTEEEGISAQPGGPDFGINSSCGGRFIIFAGGIPITYAKTVVGAIGCSSGTSQQDAEVAQAGVAAIEQHINY
jgi:uncharacterized protein GlcG (DUF336 family)